MDDFVIALLVVFIVLGLLMAASIYMPYYPEGLPEEERVIHTFTAGTVGYTQNYVSRVQDFGSFAVGVPEAYELKSAPRMEISSGALFGLIGKQGEEFDVLAPDYVTDWIKGGEITFMVRDTNKYGDLVVRWNGAEVYRGKAYEGTHSYDIHPSQIKSQNTLEFIADGPGLAFWAATAYTISDMKVDAMYGPARFFDFTVSMDELETLDQFELVWYTAKRRGDLGVEINGEEIYRGYPERDSVLAFTESNLTEIPILTGKNRLIFKAYNGSFELDDVILNTHVSMAQSVVRERFDLEKEDVDRIKDKGMVVKVYVKSVDKSGSINFKLNENRVGNVAGKQGWNHVNLNTDPLEAGSNWLEIGSNGAFDITEASIEFA